jgi:hypothetical protein
MAFGNDLLNDSNFAITVGVDADFIIDRQIPQESKGIPCSEKPLASHALNGPTAALRRQIGCLISLSRQDSKESNEAFPTVNAVASELTLQHTTISPLGFTVGLVREKAHRA